MRSVDVPAQLLRCEQAVAYRAMPAAGEREFSIVEGSVPVLISAPHACLHRRGDEWKMEEEFTAAFALLLAEETGCSAIYLCRQSCEDPNWLQGSKYKEALADLVARRNIGLVIDLHGMTNRHHMGVAIGTMLGRACPGLDVQGGFVKQGFVKTPHTGLTPANETEWRRLVIDHPRFTGGIRNHTVTRFVVEQLQTAAVQIELASAVRIVYSPATDDWPHAYTGDSSAIIASFQALCELIQQGTP